MNDKEIIKAIEKLNLAENEAKCYLALFKKDTLTASETSQLSGVPRQNTYKALEKLLMKGLIASVPGNVKRYSASDPSILKERAHIEFRQTMESELQELERQKREIMSREFQIDSGMNEVIRELSSKFKHSRNNIKPLDYVEVLKNPDQIHHRHIQLCANAKKELLGFSKLPLVVETPKLRKEQEKTVWQAVKRNVKLRVINELPADENDRLKMIEDIHKAYNPKLEEMRLIEKLPMKASIYDGIISLVVLEYPIFGDLSLTGLVIYHPNFSEGFKKLFETYWNEAIDYYVLNGKKYYFSKQS